MGKLLFFFVLGLVSTVFAVPHPQTDIEGEQPPPPDQDDQSPAETPPLYNPAATPTDATPTTYPIEPSPAYTPAQGRLKDTVHGHEGRAHAIQTSNNQDQENPYQYEGAGEEVETEDFTEEPYDTQPYTEDANTGEDTETGFDPYSYAAGVYGNDNKDTTTTVAPYTSEEDNPGASPYETPYQQPAEENFETPYDTPTPTSDAAAGAYDEPVTENYGPSPYDESGDDKYNAQPETENYGYQGTDKPTYSEETYYTTLPTTTTTMAPVDEVPTTFLQGFDHILNATDSYRISLTEPLRELVGDESGRNSVIVCKLQRTRVILTKALKNLLQSYPHWIKLGTTIEDPNCKGDAKSALALFSFEVDKVAQDLNYMEAENIFLEEVLSGPMQQFKRLEQQVINTFLLFGPLEEHEFGTATGNDSILRRIARIRSIV